MSISSHKLQLRYDGILWHQASTLTNIVPLKVHVPLRHLGDKAIINLCYFRYISMQKLLCVPSVRQWSPNAVNPELCQGNWLGKQFLFHVSPISTLPPPHNHQITHKKTNNSCLWSGVHLLRYQWYISWCWIGWCTCNRKYTCTMTIT